MIVNQRILDLIKTRLEKGALKYGEELDPFDGRDWIEESIEELLDATVYLTAKLLSIKEREKSDYILVEQTTADEFNQKDTHSSLPIDSNEVTMLHRALDDYSASKYMVGDSKTSEKFRDLAAKIVKAAQISKNV